MFRIYAVQAEFGDCLILEFGTQSEPRYILIDGGPPTTYERHLRGELQNIAGRGGKLDLAVLSHVDNDHITGLLDLIAELREQKANGMAALIEIDALWHNAFSQTIGQGNDLEPRLREVMAASDMASQAMTTSGMAVQGVGEGNQLRLAASALGIPINPGYAKGLISAEEAPAPLVFDNLSLQVIGPTRQNLEKLKTEWQEWLDHHADNIASGDPLLAAMADRSTPNLSSIMLLAAAEGKTILLTGDGRGDHLLQGLQQAGLLDPQGKIHVNILKLPHHGSDRNATRNFFKTVTADQYIISANGLYGNPDLATLIWIVEAARDQGRPIEILVTNETPSSRQLVQEYPPNEYGYRLGTMTAGAHTLKVDLAPADN